MLSISFTVTLISDSELGTGLGTETVNDLVPRDSNGNAYVPASHLKGLMREHLERVFVLRSWNRGLLDAVLGAEGTLQGSARMGDAVPTADIGIRTISRTSIRESGTAEAGSLRTSEAIAATSTFNGTLHCDADVGAAEDVAARLGLKLISAVGGGRNRGSGACRIDIAGELRSPGELLVELDRLIGKWKPKDQGAPVTAVALSGSSAVWYAVVFRADGPVCCPETPVVGVNHLSSGIAVPSSAVQGAVLTRLNSVAPGLASACFASAQFRCWPLLPATSDVSQQIIPYAVRVSLTHRISKLRDVEGRHLYLDEAIEPYLWTDVRRGSSMKGSDGVLLREATGRVKVWRTAEMPRIVTAHGVHAGGRNLYSMESLAQMVYSGFMAVPEAAAETIEKMFHSDSYLSVGKSRSVRGGGRIELRRIEASAFDSWAPAPRGAGQVFVVQSPLALPDGPLPSCANDMLSQLVQASGLGTVVEAHASARVVFGWNRSVATAHIRQTQRLRATRVISPGSVFVLESPVRDLEMVLLKGIGAGRDRGFGSILPHPGVATSKFERELRIPVVKSTDEAGKWALNLHRLSVAQGRGPTPSQIGALAAKAAQGLDLAKASEYLRVQQKERPAGSADVWRSVASELANLLAKEKSVVCRAFRAWQDLAIIHRESKRERTI